MPEEDTSSWRTAQSDSSATASISRRFRSFRPRPGAMSLVSSENLGAAFGRNQIKKSRGSNTEETRISNRSKRRKRSQDFGSNQRQRTRKIHHAKTQRRKGKRGQW